MHRRVRPADLLPVFDLAREERLHLVAGEVAHRVFRVHQNGNRVGAEPRPPSRSSMTAGQPVTVKRMAHVHTKTTLTALFPRFDLAPIGRTARTGTLSAWRPDRKSTR